MDKTKIFNKLMAILKFKFTRNAIYFLVKETFNVKESKIYKGASLIYMRIAGTEYENLYMSIVYKTKPLVSADDIVENEVAEGIFKISYQNLIGLLLADKIVAYYTEKNSQDREIANLLNQYKQEEGKE